MHEIKGMQVEHDAEPPAPVKHAGQRLGWPTIWHRDQLPFPWGAAKRLRKQLPQPVDAQPAGGRGGHRDDRQTER